MLSTIVIHPEERDIMTEIKTMEKELKQEELLIISKKDFINWYEFTRNQLKEIEMKRKELGSDFMECPNWGKPWRIIILKRHRNRSSGIYALIVT